MSASKGIARLPAGLVHMHTCICADALAAPAMCECSAMCHLQEWPYSCSPVGMTHTATVHPGRATVACLQHGGWVACTPCCRMAWRLPLKRTASHLT